MRDLVVHFVHIIAALARLLGPGGIRSVVAESVLVKQQLLILNRSKRDGPLHPTLPGLNRGAAATLSKATGRAIRYEGFRPDVLRAQSEDTVQMFEWFDSTGYAADIRRLRRDFQEVTWHSFEQWAREQDWSVLGTEKGTSRISG